MKTEKLGLESAFPCLDESKPFTAYHPGMSKRLYLAGMAMQGLLSNSYYAEQRANSNNGVTDETLCNRCFEMADELLKQESL